jgi:hypothetical protein
MNTKKNSKNIFDGVFAVLVMSVLPICAIAQSTNKNRFETEAQRLERVRALIRQEPSRRLLEGAVGNSKNTAAFCEAMLHDLLDNKGFKPIEPVAVLDFQYPIQNPDRGIQDRDESLLPLHQKQQSQYAAKQLGPFLTNSIQRCTDEEANGDERKGSVLFNGFNYAAGLPPFRTYVLPKKLNPFPQAKLVYWSNYDESTGKGRKGYSWVNLNVCEHVNGTFGPIDSLRVKNDPQGQVEVLTNYRGKLVAWFVSRNLNFVADYFDPKYITPQKSRVICSWATYPLEQTKK